MMDPARTRVAAGFVRNCFLGQGITLLDLPLTKSIEGWVLILRAPCQASNVEEEPSS